MIEKYQTYHCNLCGNEVEVTCVGGGQLTCCQQSMQVKEMDSVSIYLKKAFEGEAVAFTKYNLYSKLARKSGYHHIADQLAHIAANELVHAKLHFKHIEQRTLGARLTDIAAALKDCIDGESFESVAFYPELSELCNSHGDSVVADHFLNIGAIEKTHDERLSNLLYRLESGFEFESLIPTEWICEKCGHTHISPKAFDECPVCHHDKTYQRRMAETSHRIAIL
ncbi:desulfoferrodoxin FeS4 iron-binding domain-containing protein [Vibrio mediterranei]|uniref:ferritin family protein n=1 Tax=Vibrio mediterranei TaxID=689 RepID=UPI0017AF6425|nr:ferritin family protein [Vibrio mediterranei]NUW74396.1 desulfoferrodoxin FeS4 iron-binding domain-containing protein [Vibrio mediterranei]